MSVELLEKKTRYLQLNEKTKLSVYFFYAIYLPYTNIIKYVENIKL